MQKYKGHNEAPETADYPLHPQTGKPSDFPRGFEGCMNCGDPQHQFRTCPTRSAPGAEARFFHNLNAHKPHTAAGAAGGRRDRIGYSRGGQIGDPRTNILYGIPAISCYVDAPTDATHVRTTTVC